MNLLELSSIRPLELSSIIGLFHVFSEWYGSSGVRPELRDGFAIWVWKFSAKTREGEEGVVLKREEEISSCLWGVFVFRFPYHLPASREEERRQVSEAAKSTIEKFVKTNQTMSDDAASSEASATESQGPSILVFLATEITDLVVKHGSDPEYAQSLYAQGARAAARAAAAEQRQHAPGVHNLAVACVAALTVLWAAKVVFRVMLNVELRQKMRDPEIGSYVSLRSMSVFTKDLQVLVRNHVNQILRIRRTVCRFLFVCFGLWVWFVVSSQNFPHRMSGCRHVMISKNPGSARRYRAVVRERQRAARHDASGGDRVNSSH